MVYDFVSDLCVISMNHKRQMEIVSDKFFQQKMELKSRVNYFTLKYIDRM